MSDKAQRALLLERAMQRSSRDRAMSPAQRDALVARALARSKSRTNYCSEVHEASQPGDAAQMARHDLFVGKHQYSDGSDTPNVEVNIVKSQCLEQLVCLEKGSCSGEHGSRGHSATSSSGGEPPATSEVTEVVRLADVSMQKALADGPAAVCLECCDDQAMQTCLECAMPLCEECGIGHKRSKKTKTHVLKRFENASLVTPEAAALCPPPRGESVEKLCTACDDGDPAIVRCDTCNVLLCEACTRMHKKSKRTREHTLIVDGALIRSISEMTAKSADAAAQQADDKCKKVLDPYGLLDLDGGDSAIGSLGNRLPQGLMDITVVGAQHLPKMDMWGSCDGLVQLSFEDQSLAMQPQVHRTDCQKDSFSPEWNQTFTVEVPRVHQAGDLTLNLFDWNMTGGEELVGTAILRAPQVTKLFSGTNGSTHKLTLTLQNDVGAAVIGHDKRNAVVELKIRPFVRVMQTKPFREWQRSLRPSASESAGMGAGAGRDGGADGQLDAGGHRTPFQARQASQVQAVCKQQLTAVQDGVMRDIVNNSRFVHAQLWTVCGDELAFSSVSFTKQTFLGGSSDLKGKMEELETQNQRTAVKYGDLSSIESLGVESDEFLATGLEDFVANPEIIVSDRLKLHTKLFAVSLSVPIKHPETHKLAGLLMLYAAHEKLQPVLPHDYCVRSNNAALYALLDQSAQMLGWMLSMVEQEPLYAEAYQDMTYDLKDRVRKLWFKLRIVVRCGWVKSGVQEKERAERQWWVTGYVRKFKGAGAKSPPPNDVYHAAWACLGTFLAMMVLSVVNQKILVAQQINLSTMSPMFASLAVLIFAAPASPFGQPKMNIIGHVLALIVANCVDYLCNEDKFPVTGKALPLWFGATLVPSLTIVLMQLTGTVNPPSAAAATIYITGSKVIKSWGWMALVMPNLVGCVVFVGVGILMNNISSKRKYPQFWW